MKIEIDSKVVFKSPEGNLFILAEVVPGEAWAILSLTADEIEAGNVPFQAEYLIDDAEEALNVWRGGIDAIENDGWKPGDPDELTEAEEKSAKAPAKAIKGIIKKQSHI